TVELGVDFDGSITWNGQTIDRPTMDSYFEDAAKKNPQPEIHVNPNRLAKYDAVAKVLADAQRLGVIHIGFTGIDQSNSAVRAMAAGEERAAPPHAFLFLTIEERSSYDCE